MGEQATGPEIQSRAAAILQQVKEMGYRITGSRRLILAEILSQEGHFTAQQITERVHHRHSSIGRSTIFRTFDLLLELGFVQKIHLESGEHGYVICDRSHHHHLVCSDCGAVFDFAESLIENTLYKIAARRHFKIDSHALEIYGRCAGCSRRV